MKPETRNTPALRFPEFNDEWETKKIEEGFVFKNGLNKEKEWFGKGTPIINFTDVFNESALKASNIRGLVTVSQAEQENFSCIKGDVFFTRTSETINDIGMSAVLLEDIPGCVFSGFVLRARPTKDLLTDSFKQYCFSISSVRKEIVTKSSFTTRALTSGTLLSKVVFRFPKSKREQQKIAAFLSAVDEKIGQLARKKKLLFKYKKGVMQQIFDQTIRFKDDNGSNFRDWEEKKLSSVGTTYGGLAGKSAEDFGSGSPYVTYKQIFDRSKIQCNRFEQVLIKPKERQNLVKYGDVFFTTSSETPGEVAFASVLLDNVENLYLNSFCFGYRAHSLETLRPEFSRYLFRSERFRRSVFRLAQGSTRYNISKTEMMKLTIELPCSSEQKKIADFLSALDEKIDLLDRELERTKTFKRGLLQQLFV